MKRYAIFLFLVGCGDNSQATIDPAFEPYVARFVLEGTAEGKEVDISKLSVNFSDETRSVAGGIEFGSCTGHSIKIVRKFWQETSEANREALLYHELGHCVLRRQHLGGTEESLGIPKSVMVSDSAIVAAYWRTNRDYYIHELFNERKP